MAWKEVHVACPCGKSSDAFCVRDDGSGYCFSANCKQPNYNNKKREDFDDLSDDYVLQVFAHRGISERTFSKYNVQTKFTKTGESLSPHSAGFIYPNGSVKVRVFEPGPSGKKQIYSHGDMSNATLFLKNYFDKGSRRCITITEGEYDALTVADLLGNETAVVSVRSASSAKEDVKNEWEYINSFEKIIVNMDNDEAGQTAAKKILPLFDFKKVYNLCLSKHKDANAYVWDDEKKEPIEEGRKLYVDAWRGVKRHTPDNIVSGNEEFLKALQADREACIGTYPLPSLQQKLYGLHAGEVIVLKAMEGVGKTEVFRFIENHLLKTTKHPLGVIHLEEDNGTTLRGMAAYYSNTPVHLPDSTATVEDVFNIIKNINGAGEDRIFLRSAFDVEDEDAFANGVRFLVSVCGCRFIFLDHVTWLATGGDEQDERKKLDRISQRLKLLAKELGFALVMISHVNDEGQTRGSRNITKVANTVIRINRDLLHVDEIERSKTYFEIEKARLMGAKTGPAGYAIRNLETFLLEAPPEFVDE